MSSSPPSVTRVSPVAGLGRDLQAHCAGCYPPPRGRAGRRGATGCSRRRRRRCRGPSPLTRPAGIAPPPLTTWFSIVCASRPMPGELRARRRRASMPSLRWQPVQLVVEDRQTRLGVARRLATAPAAGRLGRGGRAAPGRRRRHGLALGVGLRRAVGHRRGGGRRLGGLLAAVDAARGEAERGDQRHQRESRPQPAHDHTPGRWSESCESIWGGAEKQRDEEPASAGPNRPAVARRGGAALPWCGRGSLGGGVGDEQGRAGRSGALDPSRWLSRLASVAAAELPAALDEIAERVHEMFPVDVVAVHVVDETDPEDVTRGYCVGPSAARAGARAPADPRRPRPDRPRRRRAARPTGRSCGRAWSPSPARSTASPALADQGGPAGALHRLMLDASGDRGPARHAPPARPRRGRAGEPDARQPGPRAAVVETSWPSRPRSP